MWWRQHPDKAVLSEDIPNKEEVEQKRKAKQQLEVSLSKKQGSYQADENRLKEKQQEVASYGYELANLNEIYEQLVKEGKALGEEINLLKQNQTTTDQLKKQLEAVEKELELKTTAYNQLVAKVNEENTTLQTEKSLYNQSIAKIPEELQKLTQLQQKMKQVEETKTKLEQSWKEAQENLQKSKEQLTKAKADLENGEKRLAEASDRVKSSKEEYTNAISKAGFDSDEVYQEAKLAEETRQALKKEIEDYYNRLSSVKAQMEQLESSLKDQQRADIEQMQAALKQLNEEVEIARTVITKIQTYFEKAKDARQRIESADNKVKDVENKLQLIKDLYDVVRGENTRKISFERYLQIEFLEQIIQSANERLSKLSNGQYLLVRSDRLEKRGRQSGLGLDVYDNYTGQLRDVKTLSGGEKFNASLCLALGMADVIQAYEGGISIETMFIDEGFGSLDEESLNKAIDTLIDLQKSGRMIGVISHVHELKQAIPAILEVEKTKEGFSRTKFVVK